MTLVVDVNRRAGARRRWPDGSWAETVLARELLAAPHLMPVEAADVLRRAAIAGDLSDDVATLAHGDLLGLPVELFAYEPLGRCHVAGVVRRDRPAQLPDLIGERLVGEQLNG